MLHGCFLTQLAAQQIVLCLPTAAAALGETTHAGLLVMLLSGTMRKEIYTLHC